MSDMVIKSSDISGLGLSSTRLVVLPACETLIMSLWPVNDYATQLKMTDFYNNVYEQGMTERAAFYKAIENLKSKEGTTPWHWAAFIMLD